MKESIKILVWAFFVVLAFVLQASHFFAVKGINPGLILLVVFLGVILEKKISGFLFLILPVVLFSFVFLPFWPKEIFIMAGLGLAAFWAKRFLTGNNFFDFLILALSANLLFHFMVNFHYPINNPIAVIAELFYNAVLGVLAIFAVKNFSYEKKTRIKP